MKNRTTDGIRRFKLADRCGKLNSISSERERSIKQEIH